jgi:hypothetical protein
MKSPQNVGFFLGSERMAHIQASVLTAPIMDPAVAQTLFRGGRRR